MGDERTVNSVLTDKAALAPFYPCPPPPPPPPPPGPPPHRGRDAPESGRNTP
jgi:hypothetical protein